MPWCSCAKQNDPDANRRTKICFIRVRIPSCESAQPLRESPDSKMNGAGSRIRTDDLLITNQLLYQLSYAGERSSE